MSKKVNWAQVDKRIRGRRPIWDKADLEALESGLKKLPDMAEQCEIIEVAQPAIANSTGAADEDESEDESESESAS